MAVGERAIATGANGAQPRYSDSPVVKGGEADCGITSTTRRDRSCDCAGTIHPGLPDDVDSAN
jgi:hypothetical protein